MTAINAFMQVAFLENKMNRRRHRTAEIVSTVFLRARE